MRCPLFLFSVVLETTLHFPIALPSETLRDGGDTLTRRGREREREREASSSAHEESRGDMSDSEDDGWETADIPDGQFTRVDTEAIAAAEAAAVERAKAAREKEKQAARENELRKKEEEAREGARRERDSKPMILVDFTVLSDGAIHNKHDKNAVNDVDAKSKLQKEVERDYAKYANDPALIAAGTVRPCSQGVYRAALATLRDEVEGHFWAAIFPPS